LNVAPARLAGPLKYFIELRDGTEHEKRKILLPRPMRVGVKGM
jgi:hypothetical protein